MEPSGPSSRESEISSPDELVWLEPSKPLVVKELRCPQAERLHLVSCSGSAGSSQTRLSPQGPGRPSESARSAGCSVAVPGELEKATGCGGKATCSQRGPPSSGKGTKCFACEESGETVRTPVQVVNLPEAAVRVAAPGHCQPEEGEKEGREPDEPAAMFARVSGVTLTKTAVRARRTRSTQHTSTTTKGVASPRSSALSAGCRSVLKSSARSSSNPDGTRRSGGAIAHGSSSRWSKRTGAGAVEQPTDSKSRSAAPEDAPGGRCEDLQLEVKVSPLFLLEGLS